MKLSDVGTITALEVAGIRPVAQTVNGKQVIFEFADTPALTAALDAYQTGTLACSVKKVVAIYRAQITRIKGETFGEARS